MGTVDTTESEPAVPEQEGDTVKTSADEFAEWLDLIPHDFVPHFIGVRKKGKSPLVPKGRSWKEKEFRLDAVEARRWLREGGNVAFVARKHLAVMDVDDLQKSRELLDPELFETLSVSSKSGGVHLYFVNGGVENADIEGVVEIRVDWRYVLAPGSYVDPGDTGGNGRYEVEKGEPPSLLTSEDLPDELVRERVESRDFVPKLRKPGGPFRNRYGWKLEDCRAEDEKLDALLSHLEYSDMSEEAQVLFDPNRDLSKSGLDMSAACQLAYWEFDAGACVDILRTFRSREKMQRDNYVVSTVEKALSKKEGGGEPTISDHQDPKTWSPGGGDITDRITVGERNGH